MSEWQAKAIADKYIGGGGGKPQPLSSDIATDLCQLANFVLWHDKKDMHGCVYPEEAFEAMCRLLNIEPHKIRAIIRPAADT